MRKLLFLFFVLIRNYTPELIKIIKKSLEKSSLINKDEAEIQDMNFGNLNSFINSVSHKLLFDSEQSEAWLNQLFELFTQYLKNKPDGGDSQGDLNWKNIMESISKMNNSNPEAINKTEQSEAANTEKKDVPELNKEGIEVGGNQSNSEMSEKPGNSLNDINS